MANTDCYVIVAVPIVLAPNYVVHLLMLFAFTDIG